MGDGLYLAQGGFVSEVHDLQRVFTPDAMLVVFHRSCQPVEFHLVPQRNSHIIIQHNHLASLVKSC